MKRTRALWAILLVICMMTQFCVAMPAGAVTAGSGTVTAENLQVEYQTNPLGLDNTAPRFSWELKSDARGVAQESYRILVADSEDKLADGPYVWDSGTVAGSDTFGIAYAGDALAATTRYYWKVISTTNQGIAETVSWWETGLLNSKIDAWDGAEWLTEPTAVSNPDIDNYTIEWDFKMVKDGASLRFASGNGYCLVWQFNINPVEQPYGGEPRFRPHCWNTGGACLDNFSVTNVIPNTEEGKHAWYTCKVVVTKSGSSYYATTYLGTVDGELVNIDDKRLLPAGHDWSLGKLGFRQYNDKNNQDDAYFDNIVVTDNTDGASNVIYTETFDGSDVPAMFSGHGSIENGTYRVGNGSHEDFEANYRVVDPKPAEGGDPLFRKDFTVDKPVKSARLYATARGYYEFSLNGEKVGDQYLAPGWTDYNYTLMYQTYDVTGMLQQGENAIGSMISQGWWSGPEQGASYNYTYGETQSVLGKLVVTYEDGTTQTIVTDNSWTYHPGPILYADNYAGEYYDARYDCEGWNTAGYDDSEWAAAGIHEPLSADVDIVSQTGEPIREVARFTDPVITEPVEGRYTFDFGQNMAGFLHIKVKGEAGATITIKHAEMLNTEDAYKKDGQSVKGGDDLPGTIYRANLRDSYSRGRKVAVDTYTLKGNPDGEEWTPRFTFHGFRYVEITGIDSLDDILEIEAIAISSDNELTTTFETSNTKVNQLYSNIIWGMRGNFVSVPTDCPNRDERLGYTGDTQIFAGTGVYLANSNQFYAKWLRDLRDYQLNETSGDAYGRVPVIIPQNNWTGGWPSNWSSAWGNAAVIVPWQLYQQYGDKQIIQDAFESMKAWCDYQMNPKRTTNYLRHGDAASGDQDNNYGDWLAVEGSDKAMTNTLYMANDFRTFSIMARAIGEDAIADEYEETGRKIVNAIMDKWGTSDGSLSINTQTPLALFLHFDLAEMTDRANTEAIAEKLMINVRDHGWKLTTGFIGVNALVPALSNNGQMEAALRLLEQEEYPSWLYSVNQGATTTWERWNSYTISDGFGSAGMNSFNHYAYGAIGEWMISGALGIQRDEANPGFAHFTLNPQYGGTLTYAKGSYASVSGNIESGWTLDADTRAFAYQITIPANTTATVLVPTKDPANVMENGIAAADAEGVTYVGYDAETERAEYEVVSGSYTFTSSVSAAPVYHDITVENTTTDVFAKVTAVQKDKAAVAKADVNSAATLSLLEDKAYTLDVEPYNTVDFTTNTVTNAKGEAVSLPISAQGLKEDLSLTASYAWIGHTNILAGITPSTQQGMSTSGAWGPANLTDDRLVQRDGLNGWTSNIVGEYPTGANQPIISFNAGSGNTFTFNRIQLYPRTDAVNLDGGSAGFPRDFTIEVSENGSDWTVVKTLTDVSAPYLAPYVIEFDEAITAPYLRMVTTRLGMPASDDGGGTNYRLQLTEFGAYNVGSLNVTTDSLRNGAIGAPYSQTLTADGEGVTWAVVEGSLPEGLFLNPADGTISGTPAETGTFTFTIKASNDAAEGTKQLSITVDTYRAVISAEAPESAHMNESFVVTVVAAADVADVRLFNTNGMPIGRRDVQVTDNEDGTKTWTMSVALGTVGKGRVLRVVTVDGEGVLNDSGVTASIDITSVPPVISSFDLPDSAAVNRTFTVTAVTDLAAAKIAVYNEFGAKMGMKSLSYEIVDGQKVWTAVMAIGTKGERTLTAYAINKYGVKGDALTDSIHVTII